MEKFCFKLVIILLVITSCNTEKQIMHNVNYSTNFQRGNTEVFFSSKGNYKIIESHGLISCGTFILSNDTVFIRPSLKLVNTFDSPNLYIDTTLMKDSVGNEYIPWDTLIIVKSKYKLKYGDLLLKVTR